MAAIVRKKLYPLVPMGRCIQSCVMHHKINNAICNLIRNESNKNDPIILHRVLPQDIEEYIAIPLSEAQQKLFDIYVRIGYTVAEA